MQRFFHTEGLSSAGHQQGMRDQRSALCRHIFRVADSLPKLPAPQFAAFLKLSIWTFIAPCWCVLFFRQVMVLENVKALLSQQTGCRATLNFLIQAGFSLSFCGRHFLRRSVFLESLTTAQPVGMPPARFGVALVHCSRQECGSSSYGLGF